MALFSSDNSDDEMRDMPDKAQEDMQNQADERLGDSGMSDMSSGDMGQARDRMSDTRLSDIDSSDDSERTDDMRRRDQDEQNDMM